MACLRSGLKQTAKAGFVELLTHIYDCGANFEPLSCPLVHRHESRSLCLYQHGLHGQELRQTRQELVKISQKGNAKNGRVNDRITGCRTMLFTSAL